MPRADLLERRDDLVLERIPSRSAPREKGVVVAMLAKSGPWRDDVLVGEEQEPSVVVQLGAASVQGALVFAQGARPIRLLGATARTPAPGLKGYAFDVDAAVRVSVYREDQRVFSAVQGGLCATTRQGLLGVREERIYAFQKWLATELQNIP